MLSLFAQMNVGAMELLLLLAVGAAVPLAVWWTGRRWLLGLTGCFLLGVLFTPADPLSALLVGALMAMLYLPGVLAWHAAARRQRERIS